MKYGETLRQRSIPEWANYNVDYDEIKTLIKQRTSPGPGKAVSIPGKDDKAAKEFENEMFSILREQHERIDLFVRSKSGEIKSRLDHVKKKLRRLRARTSPLQAIPDKVHERYSKIEEDCLKAGEEVQSLPRFIGAQRVAFQKLLKKYKKWTASCELAARFRKDIAGKPDDFSKLEVKPLLAEYTEVLHAVRTQFQDYTSTKRLGKESSGGRQQSLPGLTACPNVGTLNATNPVSDLEFDLRVSALPRATYWVHQDNLVELQVLLMKYMRLRSRGERSVSENGCIILDDPERFAYRHNTTSAEEAEEGAPKAAGTLRWVDRSDMVALVEASRKDDGESFSSACFKPKRLGDVLCTDRQVPNGSSTPSIEKPFSAAQPAPQDGVDRVRSWLLQHPNIKPLVCITSNRTRFVGLNHRVPHGLWAALDDEIRMKEASLHAIAGNDFISRCRDEALQFPHAVLQLGTEGNAANELIRVLDSSHLTERVRGFSLEVHAVAVCCKLEKLPTPFWIPALDEDIRRVPETSRLRSARGPSLPTISDSVTPQLTSTSATSVTADSPSGSPQPPKDSSTVRSVANGLLSPPLNAFERKRRRTGLSDPLTSEDGRGETCQRYWNEYDDPECPPVDDYVIYVNPRQPSGLPGAHLWGKLRRFFVPQSKIACSEDEFRAPLADEQTSLLDRSEAPTGDNSAGDDAMSSISEAPPQVRLGPTHGRMNPGERLRPRFSANESANDMISILSETRRLQDSGKFRFYGTCFISSLALVGMVTLVETTGRRKQRETVDVGATFGVAWSLIFALVALCTFLSRKSSAGWMHMVGVLALFAVICTANGALLAWVIT